jgi:hypothetical protein
VVTGRGPGEGAPELRRRERPGKRPNPRGSCGQEEMCRRSQGQGGQAEAGDGSQESQCPGCPVAGHPGDATAWSGPAGEE